QMNPELDKKEQAKEAAKKVVERHTVDRQKSRRPDRQPARGPVPQTVQEAASLIEGEIGGRLSAHQKQPRTVRTGQQEATGKLFPLSPSEAQKAIIYAEVFMPPKSKRR